MWFRWDFFVARHKKESFSSVRFADAAQILRLFFCITNIYERTTTITFLCCFPFISTIPYDQNDNDDDYEEAKRKKRERQKKVEKNLSNACMQFMLVYAQVWTEDAREVKTLAVKQTVSRHFLLRFSPCIQPMLSSSSLPTNSNDLCMQFETNRHTNEMENWNLFFICEVFYYFPFRALKL